MSFVGASAAEAAVVVVVIIAPRRKAIQRGRRRVDVGGIFSFSFFLVSFLEEESVSGTVRFDLIRCSVVWTLLSVDANDDAGRSSIKKRDSSLVNYCAPVAK